MLSNEFSLSLFQGGTHMRRVGSVRIRSCYRTRVVQVADERNSPTGAAGSIRTFGRYRKGNWFLHVVNLRDVAVRRIVFMIIMLQVIQMLF